jgi:hypothetical protein
MMVAALPINSAEAVAEGEAQAAHAISAMTPEGKNAMTTEESKRIYDREISKAKNRMYQRRSYAKKVSVKKEDDRQDLHCSTKEQLEHLSKQEAELQCRINEIAAKLTAEELRMKLVRSEEVQAFKDGELKNYKKKMRDVKAQLRSSEERREESENTSSILSRTTDSLKEALASCMPPFRPHTRAELQTLARERWVEFPEAPKTKQEMERFVTTYDEPTQRTYDLLLGEYERLYELVSNRGFNKETGNYADSSCFFGWGEDDLCDGIADANDVSPSWAREHVQKQVKHSAEALELECLISKLNFVMHMRLHTIGYNIIG